MRSVTEIRRKIAAEREPVAPQISSRGGANRVGATRTLRHSNRHQTRGIA